MSTPKKPPSAFDEIRKSVDLVGNKILWFAFVLALVAALNIFTYNILVSFAALSPDSRSVGVMVILLCLGIDLYAGWKALKFAVAVVIFLVQRNILKKAP